MSFKESKKLTYTRSDIEANEELNGEIQVADAGSNIDDKTLKTINLQSTADNKKGQKETIYTQDTEIPVMPIDFYSTSVNQINILDTDFYNTNSNNTDSFWKVIRAFIAPASHIVMYIAAALLLVMIICRSILFVLSSLGNRPEGAYASRKAMDNFIKAVLILGCIYLLMTFVMYFYEQIENLLLNGNDSMYLIRVNVEGVYSFNTNVMGYLKYMTLNANTEATLGFSIWYAIVSFFNLVWFGIMFARMIIIGILIILAPLTAVYSMGANTTANEVNTGNILNLRNFIRFYAMLMFLPLLVAAIQKIIMIVA